MQDNSSSEQEIDVIFKACIFGDGGVGKTTLIHRYLSGIFKDAIRMTIGVDFHLKKLEIEGKKIAIQLWDFGGEDRFRFLLPSYAAGSSGGIFMFDITRIMSLKNLPDWLRVFKKGVEHIKPNQNVPIIMVGGKLDLQDRRSVSSADALDLALKYELYDYIECSAKNGENVELIFQELARELTERAGLI